MNRSVLSFCTASKEKPETQVVKKKERRKNMKKINKI